MMLATSLAIGAARCGAAVARIRVPGLCWDQLLGSKIGGGEEGRREPMDLLLWEKLTII